MPKRHQPTRSRNHSKGYKLRLNPQLAHLRTVKGWNTKWRLHGHHVRVKHAAELPPDEELHSISEEDLIKQRTEDRQHLEQTPQRILDEARHTIRQGDVNAPGMEEYIARAREANERAHSTRRRRLEERYSTRPMQLPRKLQIMGERDIAQRGELSGPTKARIHKWMREHGPSERDQPYSEYTTKDNTDEREILARLQDKQNSVINRDPTNQTRAEKAREQAAADGLNPAQTNQLVQAAKRLPVVPPNRRGAVKRQVRQKVIAAFTREDPLTGQRHVPVDDKVLEEIISEATQSHVGATPDERSVAAIRARRAASKAAQQAQSVQSRRRGEFEARVAEARVSTTGDRVGRVWGPQSGSYKQADEWLKPLHESTVEALSVRSTPNSDYLQKDWVARRPIVPLTASGIESKRGDNSPAGPVNAGIKRLENRISRIEDKLEREPDKVTAQEKRLLEEAHHDLPLVKKMHRQMMIQHKAAVQQGKRIPLADHRNVPREARLGGYLNAPTAEEHYAYYGHEYPEAPSGSVAATKGKLRAQYLFNKNNLKNTVKSIRTGEFSQGWDSSGKRVKVDDATFAVAPNQKWRYQLNKNPEDLQRHPDRKDTWRVRDVEHWDTESKFHRGKRDRYGRVISGDWEELRNEERVRKYDDTINVKLGKRSLDLGRKPTNVEKDIFIPVAGLKNRSTKALLYGGEGRYGERLINVNGRWLPANQQEWELRHGERFTTERPHQHVRVHYVPDHELKLLGKEKDQLSVVLPGGKRVGYLNLNEDTDKSRRLNHLLFGYSRARQRQQLEQSSKEAYVSAQRHNVYKKVREDHPNASEDEIVHKAEGRLASLGFAAGAAVKIGADKRFRKGYGPQFVNKAAEGIAGLRPEWKRQWKRNNMRVMAVDEAYVRPAGEHAANAIFMMRHPLSDPDGKTMGIDWGRFRYREWRISPEKRLDRVVERTGNEVDRIQRTHDWFYENAYTDSWLKRRIVARRDHNLRHQDYVNFRSKGGMIDRSIAKIENDVLPKTQDRDVTAHAQNLLAKLRHMQQGDGLSEVARHRQHSWAMSHIGEPLLQQREHYLPGAPIGKKIVNGRMTTDMVGSATKFAIDHKKFLIGAGVTGAALGGAYAYHRYRESKKPPEERTAFYNKILPPAFHVPTVHLRVTGRVPIQSNVLTRELRLDKSRIPVRFGATIEQKKIAFRPADRGYDKNMPVLGGIKLRGVAHGGSWMSSITHNPEVVFNLKRSMRSNRQGIVIGGKETPVWATFGDQKRWKLSRTNPQRISNEDRENIVWAYEGTSHEDEVRNWYRNDKRMQEMFTDPNEVSRIRKKKGTVEAQRIEQMRQQNRRRSPEKIIETEGDQANVEDAFASALASAGSWETKRDRWDREGVQWR